MALIDCPGCGKQVSSFAPACPGCGCELNAICDGDIVKKPLNYESVAFDFSAVEDTLLSEMGMRRVKMILAAEEIEFRDATYVSDWPGSDKAESVYLNYSQVRNFRFVNQTLAVQRKKSVVGRAVIGGLLFGPVGAVVGGISGTGKKVSNEVKKCFVIEYISQDGEKRSLSLDCCGFCPSEIEELSTLLEERCPNCVKERCLNILSSNRL